MRKQHNYNKELESFLITLDENQFLEWLVTNEIIYSQTLEELIKQESTTKEVTYV